MFEVGQRVVCVTNHPEGCVSKGREYVIDGINKMPCCGMVVLDVGIRERHGRTICMCGAVTPNEDGHTVWIAASRFRPVDDWADTILAKVEEEMKLVEVL